jgi:V8-like Glu-specific endopeptidase
MVQLQSVPKPAVEAAKRPRPRPEPEPIHSRTVLAGSPKALTDTGVSRGRLVVGKREQPLAEGRGLESLIGADERTRMLETEKAPWRMVCALDIEAPWGGFVGTAWFAGPRTLVTAGHCVLDRGQMGGWATKITVAPGRDGDERPFAPFEATRFSTVDLWEQSQNPDYDIAAIHLDEAFGDELGWFAVGALTDAELQDHLVNVSGYPFEPGGGTQQWWARNRVRAITPRRIFYDVDTSGGQSGGPVYVLNDGDTAPLVVGIHAYGTGGTPGSVPLIVNSAPRITPEVLEQIGRWIEQDSGGH